MGTFLDVQRDLAAAATRDPELPGPSKRPRNTESTKEAETSTTMGPCATKFAAHSAAFSDCVGEMLQWINTTEQAQTAILQEHKGIEDKYKRKFAAAVQGIRDQAQRTLSHTHTEYRQQLEEKEQTLTNLRHQVANLELELRATQDHVDVLAKEKANAMERAQGLEQQSPNSTQRHAKTRSAFAGDRG